jgi:hypothetical protein
MVSLFLYIVLILHFKGFWFLDELPYSSIFCPASLVFIDQIPHSLPLIHCPNDEPWHGFETSTYNMITMDYSPKDLHFELHTRRVNPLYE